MKLYKFTLSTWRKVSVSREVLEVEEKPKTFIVVGNTWNTRILKSDVGVVSGYSNETLYLLDDDMKKANAIFAKSLRGKIEKEKQQIENTIRCCNERIKEYENGIDELIGNERSSNPILIV